MFGLAFNKGKLFFEKFRGCTTSEKFVFVHETTQRMNCYQKCLQSCVGFLSPRFHPFMQIVGSLVSNGNRTEWSPIRSVIIRVITKLDDRAAGVRFVYHEYDYRPNWTTRSPIIN